MSAHENENFQIINSLIFATLVAGCHREASPDQSGDPKVTGEKISFPAGLAATGFARIGDRSNRARPPAPSFRAG
jgi:hypothetical protein